MVAPNGRQVSGDQSKAKQYDGERTADAPGHHGQLVSDTKQKDKKVGLVADNKYKLDTVGHTDGNGRYESGDAKDSQGNTYNIKPNQNTNSKQTGTLTRNGEKYEYTANKVSASDGNAQLTNVGTGSSRKTYTCQAQKSGVSNCVDNTGLKFGEVVAQPDGTVIVKKTIAKGVDVPIGKGKVVKTADGKEQAVINDGLFTVTSGNQKQRDCMAGKVLPPGLGDQHPGNPSFFRLRKDERYSRPNRETLHLQLEDHENRWPRNFSMARLLHHGRQAILGRRCGC